MKRLQRRIIPVCQPAFKITTMKLILLAVAAGTCLCVCSCDPYSDSIKNQAYVPVYAQPADVAHIAVTAAQSTARAGKIYAFGNYVFQNDINKGIHVIDNTDKAHPQKIAFIQVPYNTEFAVRGHYMYANNLNDLVVIDIHDVLHATEIKRIANGFPYISQTYPPATGYFVCPDPSKGLVVDWELQTVSSTTNCRR